MAAVPKGGTPEYLSLPPYALVVTRALEAHAETVKREAAEQGITRAMEPIVQMLTRAAEATRAYTEESSPS